MTRALSLPLGLAVAGLLLASSSLAQTQIGGVTLTPVRPPAPRTTPTTDGHVREAVPAGYHEVRGRVTGPSEGLRLPAGSQIRVTLVDRSAARSLLDISFSTPSLSAPYQLVYNPARLNAARTYAVRAEIVDRGGKVLYRSADTALPDGPLVTVDLAVRAR